MHAIILESTTQLVSKEKKLVIYKIIRMNNFL